jgi:hypothetical protein
MKPAKDSAVPVRAQLSRGDLPRWYMSDRQGGQVFSGFPKSARADLKEAKRVLRTKRIRLTRSIILDGEHAEEGSTRFVEQELAKDLIAQGSAVQVNLFARFFPRIWFVASRAQKKERN